MNRPKRKVRGTQSLSSASRFAASEPLFDVRLISRADIHAYLQFAQRLSPGTRYFRFGRGDFDVDDRHAAMLCELTAENGTHYIAAARDHPGGLILGSAFYIVLCDHASCEFAIVVDDAWRDQGVGSRLMNRLVAHASEQGLKTMVGRVLATNESMFAFAQVHDFRVAQEDAGASIRTVVCDLQRRRIERKDVTSIGDHQTLFGDLPPIRIAESQ